MELKFTKYAVEGILERVLKEEGADDKQVKELRWQNKAPFFLYIRINSNLYNRRIYVQIIKEVFL